MQVSEAKKIVKPVNESGSESDEKNKLLIAHGSAAFGFDLSKLKAKPEK